MGGWWVPTGSHQHGNLRGAFEGICLKLHNAMMVWSTGLEWEAENRDRRRGHAQEAAWTTQLELEVRGEGRNTRNTSAPSVWEEGVVLLLVTHECSCASQRHCWALSHCTELPAEGTGPWD